MLTLFWDHQGPLVEYYMSKGTAVTSDSCCNILRNHLRPFIGSKHHGLLITDVLLLHDNTRPHNACVAAELIRNIHFECLLCHTCLTSPLVTAISLDGSGSWWKDFLIWWRSVRGSVWVAGACSQRICFFTRNLTLVKHWRTCIEPNWWSAFDQSMWFWEIKQLFS
jgi:hypothetical protein